MCCVYLDFDVWSLTNGDTKLDYTGDEEATISEFYFGYYKLLDFIRIGDEEATISEVFGYYKLLDLFIK